MPITVAWGGGVNSTAMLIGMCERNIRPDYITFADTGGEKPHTYQYIPIIREWLASVNFPQLTVVKKTSMYLDLEDNCLKKQQLPAIAYGFKTCSDKYKRQPQDKFHNNLPELKELWRSGGKVVKAVGYDAGERRRAKIVEDSKYQLWYPLIEWGWYREECIEAIRRAGLPDPGKSACFFCPSSKKWEILDLRDRYPELFARAVAMERNAAANLVTVKGLGRNFSWEQFVKIEDAKARENVPEPPEIECMCFDGDDD